ncbi:MAG: hypothetical protein KDC87_16010, partial [Planctomycetes bacterium]|nr:hypothetical protein [Planctomycetota bacterium]
WRARGDPRGEFVEVQLALADMPRWHPDRPALESRQLALQRAHLQSWRDALPHGDLAVHFQRGFAWSVSGTPAEVRDDLPRLAEHAPVTHVDLEVDEDDGPDTALPELEECAALAGVRELAISDGFIEPAAFGALLAADVWRELRGVTLGDAMCSRQHAAELARVHPAAPLRRIHLAGHISGIGDDGVDELLRAPCTAGLDELLLHGQGLTDGSLVALAQSPLRLRHLGLASVGYRDNRFTAAAVRAAARAPWLAELDSITLTGAAEGDALPELLAAGRSLRAAWLSRTELDAAALQAIVDATGFADWRELAVSGNPIGDAGARALAAGPALPRVLALAGCGIGPDGLRALAAAPPVDALDLRDNPLPADGWSALLAMDRLPRTTALMVHARDWPVELVDAVRRRYPRADLIGAAT